MIRFPHTVTLNNGIDMPLIGFGTYQITDPDLCRYCVIEAVDIGYRMIDTAAYYGNEKAVGAGIRDCGIPREELFVVSKLTVRDAGYEKAKEAFVRTLDKLGTDYLDLYLIHHPYGDCFGSWRAMEELYHEGKVRAIGVSNFEPYRYMDIMLGNEVVPAVNQSETHPFYPQDQLRETMEPYGTRLVASLPLAEGKNGIFTNPVLTGIGQKYGKTPAQVVLRWHLQRGTIIIPKSTHRERMKENFEVFDFELTPEDMELIARMDTGKGFVDRRDPRRVKAFYAR